MSIYVFFERIKVYLQLSSSLSKFSPESPLTFVFPAGTSKLFQSLHITQFQSYFHLFRYQFLCWSIRAATTNYHRLGGLQITYIYFSQLERLEVWDQGASMSGSGEALCCVTGFSQGAEQIKKVSSPVTLVKALITLHPHVLI